MKTTGHIHSSKKLRNVIELYLNEDDKFSSISNQVNKDEQTRNFTNRRRIYSTLEYQTPMQYKPIYKLNS